jgi:methylmalonyl-CoA mutase
MTRDGIAIEPLYDRRPDAQPLVGSGALPWTIVQPVDDPDPDRANAQALADITGGAGGLCLYFSGASSGQGLPRTKDALRVALEGVDFARIHLWLEPHAQQLETASWTKDLVLSSGVAPELAFVSFGLNPFSAVGPEKVRSIDVAAYTRVFAELRATGIYGSLALLDGRPFHNAGASEAQELAAILAAAAWWLRELDNAGLGLMQILPFFAAGPCVDQDLLVSLAKMRALALLQMQFAEVCGETRWHLKTLAQTSRRALADADPNSSVLRNTLAAFAAAAGGADAILVTPHGPPDGPADRNARALARNLQHLLISEARLARVADPGAGSGAVEALTEALAERAWVEFQTIEREGGFVKSLASGSFQQRIAKAAVAPTSRTGRGGPAAVLPEVLGNAAS